MIAHQIAATGGLKGIRKIENMTRQEFEQHYNRFLDFREKFMNWCEQNPEGARSFRETSGEQLAHAVQAACPGIVPPTPNDVTMEVDRLFESAVPRTLEPVPQEPPRSGPRGPPYTTKDYTSPTKGPEVRETTGPAAIWRDPNGGFEKPHGAQRGWGRSASGGRGEKEAPEGTEEEASSTCEQAPLRGGPSKGVHSRP